MLVHREVMIQVELHHRHDAPELGHEAPERAGLVHAPQRHFGRGGIGEDRQEQPVRLGVVAQGVVDALQGRAHHARGMGMDGEIAARGVPVEPQNVARIAREHVVARDVQPFLVEREIARLLEIRAPAPQPPHEPVEHRARRHMQRLRRAENDGGEIADLLRHEKIMAHEPLDGGEPAARLISERLGCRALQIEAQPLLWACGDEVHHAAHAP